MLVNMKHARLRAILAYVIASYAFMFVLALEAVLSGQERWRLGFDWETALAPVVSPFILWHTLQPSHILSNAEVLRYVGMWVVYLGLFAIVFGLLGWKHLTYSRHAKRALAIVVTVSLTLGLRIGMSLQVGWMTEHDYYPQIAKGGYADRNGNLVIRGQFADQRVFGDGLAAVSVAGKYGFINLKGEMAIPPQFEEAYGFDSGLGRVKVDGKVAFIDRQGRMVIGPQFDAASGFSEGLAAAKKGDKWGFIDTSGRFVISPEFAEVRSFAEGMAAVTSDNSNWGYIDRSGKYVIEPHPWWPWPGEFHWGSARVRDGSWLRRIDWRGEFVD